ncbi:hypothetical protein JW756_03610 [Candidatus Woesearchaeota archaeon]|nr:hypothetical protein [Candidatus Woesearchaeota archaeon]
MTNPFFKLNPIDLSQIVNGIVNSADSGIEPDAPYDYDADSDFSYKKLMDELSEHYAEFRHACFVEVLCLESQKRRARTNNEKDALEHEIKSLLDLHRQSYDAECGLQPVAEGSKSDYE